MRKVLRSGLTAALLLGLLLPGISCTETTPVTPTPTPASTTTPILQGEMIVVSSTADSGPGTLRQALLDAQSGDTITFDPSVFPPSAPAPIYPISQLPAITQGNLMIDASNAGVILDGRNITTPQPVHGLSISSNSNTIRGLQVVGFSDAGIALHSGASYNVIGGDRDIGDGPLGQGNLISGNGDFGILLWHEGTSYNTIQGNYIGINLEGMATWGNSRDGINLYGASHNLITGNVIGGNDNAGVYLCCVTDGRNTVTGNIIGTDESGENRLGNSLAGILIDRTSYNVVGPGNLIAYNDGQGIMFWEDTAYNTITRNSIHDNGERGIDLISATVTPLIFEFNMQAGNLTGMACANCTVEIFSDSSEEGAIYEGQTKADSDGAFTFSKGVAFTGPHLTATATTPDGGTSEFSAPTSGTYKSLTLQQANTLPKTLLQPKRSKELADNRIGALWSSLWPAQDLSGWTSQEILGLGVKLGRLAINELDCGMVDWDRPEFYVDPTHDAHVTMLAANGLTLNYVLSFWDKANHPGGAGVPIPRLKTETEILRYLDFVRFIVRHFKDRIQYYEMWNEPDPPNSCQSIDVADYINVVKRAVPIIRQEYPEAKIVVGGTGSLEKPATRDYLFSILNSDIMPLVDVVSWHPMFGASPQFDYWRDYYYTYPLLVAEIKNAASAHGFRGEYWATELTWWSPESWWRDPNDPYVYSEIVSAKYYARGIVMHLGMDVTTGVGGLSSLRTVSFPTVHNLCAIMARAQPIDLSVEIQSEATNTRSYSFSLANGDKLVALWTDGIAVDDDPGIEATVTLPDFSAKTVTAIDVLHGFEQDLVTNVEDGNLVIHNLMVKDYPLILHLET